MIEEKQDRKMASVDILKWIIFGLLGFALLIFVFAFGVWVGSEKAEFSFRWAENYHRNFGGPRQGFFGNFPNRGFMDGRGVFGSIIKIDPSAGSGQVTLIVKGQDNVEKTVLVSDKTTILLGHQAVKIGDFRVDNRITVIGSPNQQGQIDAKLIRVFPNNLDQK